MTELTPQYVLADLLGSGDFPVEIADPEATAAIIIQRLIDAGFVFTDQEDRPEIQRHQDAKPRAMALADERAKEANGLRLENDRLRAQVAERDRHRKRLT
jgi:hypothetical protein